MVVVFGLTMGGLSCLLNQIPGINLGWVYNFMGIVIGSAVVPLWYCLTWKDANAAGAIAGAWIGQVMAIIVWLAVAQIDQGAINVDTLGTLNCQMGGCITAIVSSGLIHTLWSLAAPQNYDWESMGKIEMLEDDQRGLDPAEFSEEFLVGALKWVKKWGYGFTIVMVVVWPVLSFPAGVFSKGYWAMWVFVSLVWGFVATVVIIALPLYESSDALLGVLFALVGLEYKKSSEGSVSPDAMKASSIDSSAIPEAESKTAAKAEKPAENTENKDFTI